jgi:fructose-specific phosphotransferase system component IIB
MIWAQATGKSERGKKKDADEEEVPEIESLIPSLGAPLSSDLSEALRKFEDEIEQPPPRKARGAGSHGDLAALPCLNPKGMLAQPLLKPVGKTPGGGVPSGVIGGGFGRNTGSLGGPALGSSGASIAVRQITEREVAAGHELATAEDRKLAKRRAKKERKHARKKASKAAKKAKKEAKKAAKKSKKGSSSSSGSSDSSSDGDSDDSSHSAQVFRAASQKTKLKDHEEFVAHALANPGLLACASLQTMENAVGRDGERPVWGQFDAPPSAKAYYLRVLKHTVPAIPQRSLREMQTICTVLDHLALGRVGEAGDVLAQRMKALELSSSDGHWQRAEHLELVAPDSVSLVNRSELKLVQREVEAEMKVSQPNSYGKNWGNSANASGGGHWGQDWYPRPKGKGKGKHEKGKWDYWKPNPKGKGKGKDKKGKGKKDE